MITHVSLCAEAAQIYTRLPNQSEIILTELKSEVIWSLLQVRLEFGLCLSDGGKRGRQNTAERDHNILFVNLQAA